MTVHFPQYFSVSKNFGAAINNACSLIINDNDWVCLTDMDTMFLRPDAGKHIYDIVEKYKSDYQLIGCTTNRLAQPYQLYKNRFNEDSDIREHIKIANELHNDFYGVVEPLNKVVAGCFMLFPITVWRHYLFQENTPCFDSIFSNEIMSGGGKIGIARGLYQFHLYRMWSNDPINDTIHLFDTKKVLSLT